jgi:hypothetical protein
LANARQALAALELYTSSIAALAQAAAFAFDSQLQLGFSNVSKQIAKIATVLNASQVFETALPENQLNASQVLLSGAVSAESATIQLLATLQALESLVIASESASNQTLSAQQDATKAASKAFTLSICSVPKVLFIIIFFHNFFSYLRNHFNLLISNFLRIPVKTEVYVPYMQIQQIILVSVPIFIEV